MTPTSGKRAPKKPVDTTGDSVLEAKWQTLVRAVIDAKNDVGKRRRAWHEACVARGPIQHATPEASAAADAAKAAYETAKQSVLDRGAAMKAGVL